MFFNNLFIYLFFIYIILKICFQKQNLILLVFLCFFCNHHLIPTLPSSKEHANGVLVGCGSSSVGP
jgi:hypothetical protein